jgi:hypothetical protein
MEYIKPETVLSPKGTIEDLEVIYVGGEHSWSLARMKWDGESVVAMRWNGGREKKIPPSEVPGIGTPSSRGYPTWFILPQEVAEMIETSRRFQKKISK